MNTVGGLRIYVVELARALEQNLPPPPIPPDLPVEASSEIDLLLTGLGMAAGAGDAGDMLAGDTGYAERELATGAAMAKFPANEEQAGQALQQVMGAAAQLPESFSGAGPGAGGVFGGFFQSLNQALQQGLQAGRELTDPTDDDGGLPELVDEPTVESSTDAYGFGVATPASSDPGTTASAARLGPPEPPSAATFPASSTGPPPSVAAAAAPGPANAVGYPPLSPGLLGGTGAGTEPKGAGTSPETRRIVSPAVRNGAPVQGRISAPPALPEVTKRSTRSVGQEFHRS